MRWNVDLFQAIAERYAHLLATLSDEFRAAALMMACSMELGCYLPADFPRQWHGVLRELVLIYRNWGVVG